LCHNASHRCLQALDRQLATEQGSKLDTYELEVAAERGDVLQDLAEFQLAAVRREYFFIYLFYCIFFLIYITGAAVVIVSLLQLLRGEGRPPMGHSGGVQNCMQMYKLLPEMHVCMQSMQQLVLACGFVQCQPWGPFLGKVRSPMTCMNSSAVRVHTPH